MDFIAIFNKSWVIFINIFFLVSDFPLANFDHLFIERHIFFNSQVYSIIYIAIGLYFYSSEKDENSSGEYRMIKLLVK